MSILGATSAANQYSKIAGMAQQNQSKGAGFQDILSSTLKETADSVRSNESLAKQHVVDNVDLTRLTTDTAQLDVAITTITALRDKVIGAIQELQKMPI
jgi:flagellar hook-basal body complex protein FliE